MQFAWLYYYHNNTFNVGNSIYFEEINHFCIRILNIKTDVTFLLPLLFWVCSNESVNEQQLVADIKQYHSVSVISMFNCFNNTLTVCSCKKTNFQLSGRDSFSINKFSTKIDHNQMNWFEFFMSDTVIT